KLPRDAVIIRKGDDADSMYFIANGEVEVVLPDRTVQLHQGDFFGEMAVLGRTKRNATVIARQPCELLVLDAADVLKFIEQNPRSTASELLNIRGSPRVQANPSFLMLTRGAKNEPKAFWHMRQWQIWGL